MNFNAMNATRYAHVCYGKLYPGKKYARADLSALWNEHQTQTRRILNRLITEKKMVRAGTRIDPQQRAAVEMFKVN